MARTQTVRQYADVIWSTFHKIPLTIRFEWPRKTLGRLLVPNGSILSGWSYRNSQFSTEKCTVSSLEENNELNRLNWSFDMPSIIGMLGKVVGHKLLLHEVLDWAEVRPHKRLCMAIVLNFARFITWKGTGSTCIFWWYYSICLNVTLQMVLEQFHSWENINFMHYGGKMW